MHNRSHKYRIAFAAMLMLAFVMAVPLIRAQEAPTPTPILISLPTDTPIPAQGSTSLNVVVPTWTPTGVGQVILEALDIANVRALPDTNATQLGVIHSGEFYVVTGKYVNWYQLQYDPAPDGFGWVYGELVRLTGDATSIRDVDPYSQPTTAPNPNASSSSDGGGIIATVTAQGAAGDGGAAGTADVSLPTFTYPPGLARPNGTDSAPGSVDQPTGGVGATPSSDMPPIVPIVVLGGLGLLGLAITSLRR